MSSSAVNRFVSWYFAHSAELALKPWSTTLQLYVTRGGSALEFQDWVAIYALPADAVKGWCAALSQLRDEAAVKEQPGPAGEEKSPA